MKLLIIFSLNSFHSRDVEYLLVFPFLSRVFKLKGLDQKMNLSKHILQVKERLVTSSKPFFFMMLSIGDNMGTGCKGKANFFMVSLKTFGLWNFKISRLLHALVVLDYLPKLRWVMGRVMGLVEIFCILFS